MSPYLVLTLLFFLLNEDCVLPEPNEGGEADFSIRSKRQDLTYGITHLDIRESIEFLQKSIKSLEDKLIRHEFREAQVADFSTKTLNALNADHALTEKNMQSIARQLAKMEERMMSTETLVKTTDERQRHLISKLSEGVNRLLQKGPTLPGLPPLLEAETNFLAPDTLDRDLKKLARKINVIDSTLNKGMTTIASEVKSVKDTVSQNLSQLSQQHQSLTSARSTCDSNHLQALGDITQQLTQTRHDLIEQVESAKNMMTANTAEDSCSPVGEEVMNRLTAIDEHYKDQEEKLHVINKVSQRLQTLEEQQTILKTLLTESRKSQDVANVSFALVMSELDELEKETQEKLGDLGSDLKFSLNDKVELLKNSMDSMSTMLKLGHSDIMDAIDDTASQAENVQRIISENHDDLSKDVRGLKKVEQVMINTADAVLDTKRSIEFGIQQVILELSEIVKNSGKNINSTISDHISNISFAILKNQTMALTNMTSKVEKEISQVWRQIGIMYQQMAQSVDLLDELQNTTRQHMNASLSRVGNMDGTVGQISNKVAGVEDNLNYLLGRLSLVVSEFSDTRNVIGGELERLRELANNSQFQLPEFQKDELRYTTNRKRSIYHRNHSKRPYRHRGYQYVVPQHYRK